VVGRPLDTGEFTVHDNRVVVGGRARDKAGGKTHSADKAISIDRATVPVLRRWRKLQNGEREFFGPTITQATTGSPSGTAGHRTPTRLAGMTGTTTGENTAPQPPSGTLEHLDPHGLAIGISARYG
jgi:hypothetical protein